MDEMETPVPEQPGSEPPAPEAPQALIPWEDRGSGLSMAARIKATIGLILLHPDEAGPALAQGSLTPALTFCALLALPAQWIIQAVVQLSGAAQTMQTEAMAFLHLPAMPEPTAQQLAIQKIVAWVSVAAFPVSFALGLAMVGGLMHLGLWMTRAAKRGVDVTFRTLFYAQGALSWMSLIIGLGVLAPGALRWITQLVGLAVGLGFFTYQGILLAKAHGVETWRGVVGVFLIPVLVGLCFGCCMGLLIGGAAAAASGLH